MDWWLIAFGAVCLAAGLALQWSMRRDMRRDAAEVRAMVDRQPYD